MAEEEPRNEEDYLLNNVFVKVEVEEDGVIEGIDETKQTGAKVSKKPKNRSSKKRKKPSVTLSCDECDYKTTHKACLKFHIMKHTNTSISCKLCTYSTKYPTSLQRHILSFHQDTTDLPRYKCTECSYESIFKSNLAGHMRKHSTDKKFQCKKCEFATAYSLLLVKHNRTRHSGEKNSYQCDKCPFIARTDAYLVRHLAQIHQEVPEKVAKCENCNFFTKTRWRLTIHRKKSYQNAPLNCTPCEFVTNYKCEYRMHKKKHEPQKTVQKSEADKFCQDGLMSNHIQGFSDPQMIDTSIHTSEHTLNSQDLSMLDNKNFNNAYQLSMQRMDHTSFYNQYAEIDYKTVEDYINWRDIPVHEISGQEKPFLCTMCGHTSKFKAAVQRHFQRRHMSNTKPYKCVNCDFSTKTKDQIALHNKRSKSDSLQCCPNCTFVTYFKCHLVMHQKVHFPYKCNLCDYSCRQKFYMQKHYINVHKKYVHNVTPHEPTNICEQVNMVNA